MAPAGRSPPLSAMARIVTVNEPGILSAALLVGGMILAHGFPVQAVAGDFFRQYPFAQTLVGGRVEQGKRIDAQTLHPPAINLHFADIERLSG